MFRNNIRNEPNSTNQDANETHESRMIALIDRAAEFELLAAKISNEVDDAEELRLLLIKASEITRQRINRYLVTHDLKLFQ